jgi:peptide/nickel transport system ATP-binding protein/oligopeptide transport system ATP-binding protein
MVGESGCGKSVSALSLLRLIQEPPGKIVEGEIWFKGEDLLKKRPEQIRKIRGKDISMIFQEPMTSLNPLYTIGEQISETIVLHQKLDKEKAIKKTVEMLKMVDMPFPEKSIGKYPHELSGGQRQRVMIAMALSCNPNLLIADEPTTALDVTIQAQILELIKELKDEIGMSVLIITHDLGVIAEVSDSVAVVYAGKVVEYSDLRTMFKSPQHPYTISLLNCIPCITDKPGKKLEVIQGEIPDPLNLPDGCKFYPRCKFAINFCEKEEPELEETENAHFVSCWMYNKNKKEDFIIKPVVTDIIKNHT